MEFSLGEAFLRSAVRGVASFVPGGVVVETLVEEVALPFCKAAWEWLRQRPEHEQQQAVEALAQMPVATAQALSEQELQAAGIEPAARARLVSYLSVVPMTVQRAVSRVEITARPTVLLSQLPRSESALLRFLPARAPRFKPGDPVPGQDFDLEALLGQGSFGEVWRGRHVRRRAEPPRAFKFCLDAEMKASLEPARRRTRLD
jgi:hypothetical protein